jgi:hypothetical protein
MDMPDLGDEADAPIIVPKPGQILRRSARTKIRKHGQTGEGPHRFQTRSRRISGPPVDTNPDQEPPLPVFDSGLGLALDGQTSATTGTARPESYSDEAFIYDAYAVDDPAEAVPVLVSQPPPDEDSPSPSSVIGYEPQHPLPIQPHMIPIPPTPLHHPQPQHYLAPTNGPQPSSRTPSPDAPSLASVEAPQHSSEPYHSTPTISPPPSHDRKEKDKNKKGGFFGWGGEKGKKGSKEKEKDSSFLGSLFGGSKKKHEESSGTGLGSGSGRETAAALLGASKSKSRAPSPTPQVGGPYARYPIHVERAIYRLSHIKLANPRRPLYEQVLISNLMFWYLGVINNKGQTNATGQNQSPAKESQQQQQQGTGQHPQTGQDPDSNLEKERREQEEREKAERERIEAEKEREKEREREKELLAQQQQQSQRREQKRGPLTKPAPGPPGSRRAEMPVRGPQYEMQHRVMEQEYGVFDPRNPAQNRPGPMVYNPVPQLVQPQPQLANNPMYYGPGNSQGLQKQNGPSQRSLSPHLPPGAMPPVGPDQGQWKSQVPFRSIRKAFSYLDPIPTFLRRVVQGGPSHRPKSRTAKVP